MKRILLLLVGVLLFAPALQAVPTFQAPAADAVIEKYLAAMGGRDALSKLTSRRATGTVLFNAQGNDINGTYEVSTKAPNKVRVQIKLDLSPMGMPDPMMIDQRFDGTAAMNMNSIQGNTTDCRQSARAHEEQCVSESAPELQDQRDEVRGAAEGAGGGP